MKCLLKNILLQGEGRTHVCFCTNLMDTSSWIFSYGQLAWLGNASNDMIILLLEIADSGEFEPFLTVSYACFLSK